MKLNPNEPINALPPDVAISECFAGLTKREHMAIEFTKALLSNPSLTFNGEKQTIYNAVKDGVFAADELVKHLNTEQ